MTIGPGDAKVRPFGPCEPGQRRGRLPHLVEPIDEGARQNYREICVAGGEPSERHRGRG
jgi:hypothetical protein